MNLVLIFLTGLTTGGLSCLAMQGGLLASVMANEEQPSPWKSVLAFLGSKLVAHIALGFLLGWLGSLLTLSLEMRLFFQAFTAFFMFATAMNLLHLHPIFRFVVLQPPAFVRRLIRNTSHRQDFFAPVVLGVFTVLIPCGVTQAMEVLAINSGSPWQGALIMGSFVLGTTPLFAGIGFATAKLTALWQERFLKAAAYGLVIMALYSLNGVLVVLNSPVTFEKIVAPVTYFFSDERFNNLESSPVENGVQKITINVRNNGYSPNRLKVKKGQPVELTLVTDKTYSCAVAFVFKEFGINTFLEDTGRRTFTFTPQKTGTFPFSCSMGMYSGTLEVI